MCQGPLLQPPEGARLSRMGRKADMAFDPISDDFRALSGQAVS